MRIADTADPGDALVHHLLHEMTCVIVDHPGEVAIQITRGVEGTTLTIRTHHHDIRLIIGAQGRNARALRTIVSGIGRQLGRHFTVVIEEGEESQTPVQLDSRENLPV